MPTFFTGSVSVGLWWTWSLVVRKALNNLIYMPNSHTTLIAGCEYDVVPGLFENRQNAFTLLDGDTLGMFQLLMPFTVVLKAEILMLALSYIDANIFHAIRPDAMLSPLSTVVLVGSRCRFQPYAFVLAHAALSRAGRKASGRSSSRGIPVNSETSAKCVTGTDFHWLIAAGVTPISLARSLRRPRSALRYSVSFSMPRL